MKPAAYIFSGPTLPSSLLRDKLGHVLDKDNALTLGSGEKIAFLPPVSEGDVMKLMPLQPKIIGIIDGYFETVPAVWHKEILWAMSQGVHVLGASSMGALRAAELEAFGMEGIGAVFRAFSDGLLEDDDEVTVVHGAAELGFPLLSEALVNIRRTLDAAGDAAVLNASERAALLSAARQLHYKQRTYARVLAAGHEQGIDPASLKRFADWLPEGRKDQKLDDAVELFNTIRERLGRGIEPKKVSYVFENTTVWQRARTKE